MMSASLSPSAAPLLVLDFDGTMTDAEVEGLPFRVGYLEDLALLCGRPTDDPAIQAIADQVEIEIAAAPAEHGFEWRGRAVAPASVDPYLRMVPVARRILDHYGAFTNPDDRARLLGTILYKYNYAKTRAAFRPGARAALAALRGTEAYVVTNSDTHAVQRKLEELDGGTGDAAWLAPRVRGYARKFEIEDSWPGPAGAPVAAELRVPGLSRPVLLRRSAYCDALGRLLDATGRGWSALCVVGDIFELDLALPLALGARVGLIANARTPAYEIDFVTRHPRGRVLRDLAEIPAFIGV